MIIDDLGEVTGDVHHIVCSVGEGFNAMGASGEKP